MKPNETSQMATVRIARYLAVNFQGVLWPRSDCTWYSSGYLHNNSYNHHPSTHSPVRPSIHICTVRMANSRAKSDGYSFRFAWCGKFLCNIFEICNTNANQTIYDAQLIKSAKPMNVTNLSAIHHEYGAVKSFASDWFGYSTSSFSFE